MENYEIHNGDGLAFMERMDPGIVDMILVDPPYGTVNNIPIWSGERAASWDVMDIGGMFRLCDKVLRPSGMMAVFAQGGYTVQLHENRIDNLRYCYRYIWLKNGFGNPLNCKKAPLNYTEDVLIFHKLYDTHNIHPVRAYSKKILDFMEMRPADMNRALGHRNADHFMRYKSEQFRICTEATYKDMLAAGVADMPGVWSYEDMARYRDKFKKRFHLPKGKRCKGDVLDYKRDVERYHPTQKPVKLLEDLIKTYTIKGETVLDFACGSGSTGVAAINTCREFIGVEISPEYCKLSNERMKNSRRNKAS